MSAASSLLRRRSWRVLTSLVKHRQRELEYLTATSRGNKNGFRDFTDSQRLVPSPFPEGLVQDRQFFASRFGVYRKFATNSGKIPTPSKAPPEAPKAPPEAPRGSRVQAGTKIAAVAVTLAAFSVAAAFLVFDVQPPAGSKYLSQRPREEQKKSVDLSGKGSSVSKPGLIERPSTESKPTAQEERSGMLGEIRETSLKPEGIGNFDREPDVQNKDIEDAESSPQTSVEKDGLKGLPQSADERTIADIGDNNSTNIAVIEVKEGDGQSSLDDSVTDVREEIGQSLSNAFWIDPANEGKDGVRQSPRGTVTKESGQVGQSHPRDSWSIGSEGPSGLLDIPVDSNRQSLASTNVEDLEADTFRKKMQETAKEEDLKEFSDKILYNQIPGDADEKQAVRSIDAGNDLQDVVSETIEAVTGVAQGVKEIPGIPGIAEAYHLDKKETEESRAEEYGSDQFFKYAGAIAEAEKRQFESDEQFREMLLKLDEEYQQELREARKQQEEQVEYAKKLKKDLSVEKARWEEEARLQLHAAEERLRKELRRKEEEAKRELEKLDLLTQARTNVAVTAEKARHLEDTKELQIQVEALNRAFNSQSEGARVSHTTHKLAMGAFAFEEAMTTGAPLEEEVELLKQAAGGNDELIDVALQSLPEDALTKGTKTQIQLEREFARLRGPLRQLALIPAGQGGLLSHAIATAVSVMKVREGTGRQGVESVIATVEECLANGDLSLAANVLEQGVQGSRAEAVVLDWTRHARSRVISEQALALIQAHVIAKGAGIA